MTPDTLGPITLLALGMPAFARSLPRDPASLFVLALSLGAVGAVVVANLPRGGGKK